MIKYLQNLLLKVKEINKPNVKQLTDYERAQYHIKHIDPSKFAKFNNNTNSTIVIRTIYNRISTYNKKLREVTSYLKNDKIIYNAWCLEIEESIRTNDFFLDEEDKYIDESKYVEDFTILSIIFLSFYYEHSLLVEVGEHNQRVLTNFTNSLLNTIEDLYLIAKT